MRRNNRFYELNTAPSVINQDQLQQILNRNQSFIRDFLLVICCVAVFVTIIVFILLVLNINRTVELAASTKLERQRTYLANLDLRARDPTKFVNLKSAPSPAAAASVP